MFLIMGSVLPGYMFRYQYCLVGGLEAIVFGSIRWCVWSFRPSSPLRLPHLKCLLLLLSAFSARLPAISAHRSSQRTRSRFGVVVATCFLCCTLLFSLSALHDKPCFSCRITLPCFDYLYPTSGPSPGPSPGPPPLPIPLIPLLRPSALLPADNLRTNATAHPFTDALEETRLALSGRTLAG